MYGATPALPDPWLICANSVDTVLTLHLTDAGKPSLPRGTVTRVFRDFRFFARWAV